MGLAEALKAERDKGHVKRCSVCTLVDAMPPDDAAALRAAFDDKALTSTAIVRALVAEGYEQTANNVNRHRRGECKRT